MSSGFLRFAEKLPAFAWLLIALSLLPVTGWSILNIRDHLTDADRAKVAEMRETIEAFTKETIRLTFRTPQKQTFVELSDAVRIAPAGILDPLTEFKWVTTYTDTVPLVKTAEIEEPRAPPRILDPNWNP